MMNGAEERSLPVEATRVDAIRVGLLGANLWAVSALVPAALSGPRVTAWLLAMLPLPVLALAALALRRLPRIAPWLLLGAFPLSVAVVVSAMPSHTVDAPYPAMALFIVALALLAYGAAAAAASERPHWDSHASSRPLPDTRVPKDATRRRRIRGVVLTLGAIGAFALAVVAPLAGGERALRASWGEGAPEAGVLSAVVAGSLATLMLAAFLGPSTRRRKHLPSSRQRRTRVALLLMVVLTGAGVWWMLQR